MSHGRKSVGRTFLPEKTMEMKVMDHAWYDCGQGKFEGREEFSAGQRGRRWPDHVGHSKCLAFL